MIPGLGFEYAHARLGARLAQRPDERLWQRLRSARTVVALLEAVRASQAAAMVTGIPVRDAELLELAFRQQLRLRIDEIADWSPMEWQPALRYTSLLVDLPALVQLLRDEAPPRWIAADPVLAPYAQPQAAQRRAALAEGGSALAQIAAAVDADSAEVIDAGADASPAEARRRGAPRLHVALRAWEAQWRSLWPRADAPLDGLAAVVRSHVLTFAAHAPDAAWAARDALATQLARWLHHHPAEPVALFAGIALHALDLERLRGEFVLRARMGDATPS